MFTNAKVVQVSEGLKYLHERTPSVVHGDIRGVSLLVHMDCGVLS
jgi:hypothetical protein